MELRMLKAEAVARKFEVRQLREQMNPHFLFNALNAVVASKHDPEAVESVTRDLADFLRFTLGEARTFEPLSRELQSLENALHYGGKTSTMPLKVDVTAKVNEGWLEVVVANSGCWVAPDPTRSPTTGIRSLRKRLALLIDENATVDTVVDPNLDGGWVRVVVRMPATLVQTSKAAKPAGTAEPDPAPAHELTRAPGSG